MTAAAPAVFKSCGDCSLCCKALAVPEIGKLAGSWCRHFSEGVGCSIHAERPSSCKSFQCVWTATDALGEDWRPDRCRLVVWSDHPGRIVIDPDPAHPEAWRHEPFHSQIKSWSVREGSDWHEVVIRVGGQVIVVFPEAEIDIGPIQPGHRIDSGYRVEDGRRVPFARFGALISSGVTLQGS